MLQWMAEDMEFSECLDAAAKEGVALRRIAYVAAFAMSNYSSTIGRIAKPLNPMLVRLSPLYAQRGIYGTRRARCLSMSSWTSSTSTCRGK